MYSSREAEEEKELQEFRRCPFQVLQGVYVAVYPHMEQNEMAHRQKLDVFSKTMVFFLEIRNQFIKVCV